MAPASHSNNDRAKDLAEVIANHEVEISCSQCHARFMKTVAFLKAEREMRCPVCSAPILLDVSSIQGEVRRVEKSLRALHSQLSEQMRDAKKSNEP
jgi:DNA-directed RNA polymerase subunit RPC12/RpoP